MKQGSGLLLLHLMFMLFLTLLRNMIIKDLTPYVGKLVQETVWLGDVPVATLRPNGGSTTTPIAIDIFYVHVDHLGTPRAITRPTDNKVVWSWDSTEAFGNNLPNENPSALGAFKYNLRMPGQQWDKETNTHYNWNRDYDASTGRYIQSDPIGLDAGINTFSYALNRPTTLIDPDGLQSIAACANPANAAACIEAGIITRATPFLLCPPGEKKCTMASKWQLGVAGITDEHDFKEGWIGKKNGSKYDICACDDGSIVLRGRGKCGTSGPTIDTGSKWK